MFVPKKVFLTKGVGRERDKLTSFEAALRDAGIASVNLVQVSSIFPPNCKIVSRNKGLSYLTPGAIVFCVMSQNATNEPHRLLAASIGLAVPKEQNQHGYLSEYHSFGETELKAGDYAEDLAATMLATTLGVEFDPETSYDERKETWKISDKIVRTLHITQTAIGDKRGWWTTVVATAVLLP
ncbi:MAG: arginine decarboxylase, pyruvoyl-dependent [Nitrospirota bacterium]